MQKSLFALFFLLYFLSIGKLTAGSAGRNYTYETQEIVLYPSAGLVGNKHLFNIDFLGNDPLILSFETLVINNLSIGGSISFNGLLGNSNKFSFAYYPAIKIKYRFLNEGKYYPAMSVGFDSRNFIDIPIDKTQEFHHSIGPYIVLSKAFSWQFGVIGVHFGANFPIEYNSNNRGNFFSGFEHSLNDFTSVVVEYDYNGAYNKKGLLGKGILNLGLKYSIDRNVTLQFYSVDVLSQNFATYKIFRLQFITKLY